MGGIALAVAYIIMYINGRSINIKIANKWFDSVKDLFSDQFSNISYYNDTTIHDALIHESCDTFKFWASGRRFCTGVLATIELKKRQDLLSYALSFIDLSTNKDTLTLEFPMSEENMETFVFAICKKKEEKRLKKANIDLENFAHSVQSKYKEFAVLTDTAELEEVICQDRFMSVLIKNIDCFISFHATDSYSAGEYVLTPWKKVLRFKFLLPSDDMSGIRKLTELALSLVDRIASASPNITLPSLKRNRDAREKLVSKNKKQDHQLRLEAAQKKKEEQRAKELEARAKMTPEQRQRAEEKEAKEKSKKNVPKVRVMR